uniref:4Fe-4S ferredoxin iron-sulfur binding domain protein n=1 Tax=uncultured organism TaxID=155900 RepID=M1Q191_9ZZZZ|nr:4Fe-4S ferredoxin iron-sulfur binding domain protein [uncultured organism]
MPTSTIYTLIKQLITKKATNPFPVKHTPKNMHDAAELIEKGKLEPNPPVEIPEDFRGKLTYDVDSCVGCNLCVKVCPSEALVPKEEEGKVKHYVSRCTFCGQCVDICPQSCFEMTDEFLIAGTDKNAEDMVLNP